MQVFWDDKTSPMGFTMAVTVDDFDAGMGYFCEYYKELRKIFSCKHCKCDFWEIRLLGLEWSYD